MNNPIVGFTDPAISAIVYDISGAPLTVYYDLTQEKPEVPAAYNKHRDGPWPTTERQIEYIKVQRELYNKNLAQLYQGFQAKLVQRFEELGNDMAKVREEAGPQVMAQANCLYYTHIWRKTPSREIKEGYLVEIFHYWRDISHGMARKEYDHLWQYVAGEQLPVELMVVPGEYEPGPVYRLKKPSKKPSKKQEVRSESRSGNPAICDVMEFLF